MGAVMMRTSGVLPCGALDRAKSPLGACCSRGGARVRSLSHRTRDMDREPRTPSVLLVVLPVWHATFPVSEGDRVIGHTRESYLRWQHGCVWRLLGHSQCTYLDARLPSWDARRTSLRVSLPRT